jgi:hypothetical protein
MRGQTPAGAPILPPAPFDVPGWAFPLPAPTAPPPTFDSVTPRRVHGSTGSFTGTQAQNRFSPADWYPSSHGAMPDVLARGRKPVVRS